MGDGWRARQTWVYPLVGVVVAVAMTRPSVAVEDGLFDVTDRSGERRSAEQQILAAADAPLPSEASDVQPFRVRGKASSAPASAVPEAPPPPVMAPATAAQDAEVGDAATDTGPLDAREFPRGATSAASSPEPLPPVAEPGARRRSGAVPTAPPPVAQDDPSSDGAPESGRSPGPQVVQPGSRGDRGYNGTMAVIQDVPHTAGPPRRDAHSARIVENFGAQIDVPAGQSVIVRLRSTAERVAIADPEVADVVLVNPREILINGRGRRHQAPTGETVIEEAQTSLVVWDKEGRSDIRELFVNRSRTEQIELRVTMAELNRTALENQGYDFKVFQDKILISSQLAKLANFANLNVELLSPTRPGPYQYRGDLAVANDRVTFSVVDFKSNFLGFVEILQREGLAKILARPSVLTRSGEEAHFRAGGEVPVPLVTNNQSAVQFKEFGAIVNFTPTFQSDGSIDLRVSTELSEPDTTVSGAVIGGFVIPGFKSRMAQTRVRLRDKQSLLIAGLLRDEESEDERKVPYIGDIPYLGAIFRNTNFVHKKTELIVMVQPHVVSMDRDDALTPLPSGRRPLSRGEVRSRATANSVTRPRVNGPSSDYTAPRTQDELPEPGTFMEGTF